MKGTFINENIEYKLEIQGETWQQGQKIIGQLVIKNHSNEDRSVQSLQLRCALGNLKKVKSRETQAFETLFVIPLHYNESKIPARQQLQISWESVLDKNSTITDSTESPYLVLMGEEEKVIGILQLIIQPSPLFEELAQVLVLNERFVIKQRKNSTSAVVFKMIPPQAKTYSALEQLLMTFSFINDACDLQIDYEFTVKGVNAVSGSVKLSKTIESFQQQFKASDYRAFNGRFKPDLASTAIEKIVGPYRSRGV